MSDKKPRGNKKCCVYDCNNYSSQNPDLSFYEVPSQNKRSPLKRNLWLTAINREAVDDNGKPIKNKLWSPQSK